MSSVFPLSSLADLIGESRELDSPIKSANDEDYRYA